MASQTAKKHEQPCIVVTFDRHPAAVLAPDKCPPALATLEQNVIAIRQCGISACLIMPFTKELSEWTCDRFFQEVMLEALHAERVVVGHDFAFGHDRQGTPEWLQQRIETKVMEPFLIDGERVSSRGIRSLIADGEVGEAAKFLGRSFSLAGLVVQGQKLGRTLGFPTINLARSMKTIVPKDGVYAGSCRTWQGQFAAAISVGMRPTVGGTHRTIEAFLLDYPGDDLYGANVELFFLERLRDELNFSSLEALKDQMVIDTEHTRAIAGI